MDFGAWLVHKRWLKRAEFRDLVRAECRRVFSKYYTPDGFQSCSIDELGDDLEAIREAPFGKNLEAAPAVRDGVLARSGLASVEALIEAWYAWHRDHLEPICEYSLKHYMGRQLYLQQRHKKWVGRFLVDAHVDGGGTLIRPYDVVVILEGTSGLYAGLAIAAAQRHVTVHTSNSGLIREYRDNPAVNKGLHELYIIGGKAEYEYCEVGGTDCVSQYRRAIDNPQPATILIVPVTRLTADQGPTATGPSCDMRGEIVQRCLESHHIRHVVFVADYTKLIGSNELNDRPIFAGKDWSDLVQRHSDRMLIVTSPSPGLQGAREIARVFGFGAELHVQGRDLETLQQRRELAELEFEFSAVDREYDRAAKALDRLVGDNHMPRFHEALDPVAPDIRRVALRFVSLNQDLGLVDVMQLLARTIGPAGVDQLKFDLDGPGATLTVKIEGPAERLATLHQAALDRNTVAEAFGASHVLQSVTVYGVKQGRPWEISADGFPVDRRAILAKAF
jgi:hypothetical protein